MGTGMASENEGGGRVQVESVREALNWINQLYEDVASGDWATAYQESLPVVSEYVENKAGADGGDRCPGCGHEGGGDDVLAGGQRWCPDTACRVVSFRTSLSPSVRHQDTGP